MCAINMAPLRDSGYTRRESASVTFEIERIELRTAAGDARAQATGFAPTRGVGRFSLFRRGSHARPLRKPAHVLGFLRWR